MLRRNLIFARDTHPDPPNALVSLRHVGIHRIRISEGSFSEACSVAEIGRFSQRPSLRRKWDEGIRIKPNLPGRSALLNYPRLRGVYCVRVADVVRNPGGEGNRNFERRRGRLPGPPATPNPCAVTAP